MKAEAMKRAITTAMRVASNDDGDGNGGKSNGYGNEGAGRATTRAMAVAMTVAVMRVASNKKGEGGKAMETMTRLAGEKRRQQRRGQWQWGQGWWARMRAIAMANGAKRAIARKRAMAGPINKIK